MAERLRGADRVARSLAAAGIERIFSLSGNHVMSVYDASIEAGLRITHVRHEAAAVHMADAWSRLTGQPGVALLTGGPGHANGLSALYTALASESAIVLLSGHAPTDQLGRGAFQEMAQADMAAPVTKAAWTVTRAEELGAAVAAALRLAGEGRPGPVHLSLPDDLLNAVSAAAPLPAADAFEPRPRPLPEPAAQEFAQALQGARRPLILAGPHMATASAGTAAADLEAASGIPVLTMESPRGVNEPALGAFAEVLAEADCVLLLGKQPDFTTAFCRPPALSADCQLLQIDPESAPLARLHEAVAELPRTPRQRRADVAPAARALTRAFPRPHEGVDWHAAVREAVAYRPAEWREARGLTPDTRHPAEICAAVQPLLDSHPQAVLISDGGEFGQWAQACLSAPRRIINGPAGAIGSAPAFAAAASLAFPEAPVVALMGDGTIGFHLAEFDTGVREGLAFVAVVGNDACWNAEHQIQLRHYGAERTVACELLPSRYDAAVAALGGHGELVRGPDSLADALARARGSGRPACVNVLMDRIPAPVIRRAGTGGT